MTVCKGPLTRPSYLTSLGCNNSMVRIISIVSLQTDDGSQTLASVALFAWENLKIAWLLRWIWATCSWVLSTKWLNDRWAYQYRAEGCRPALLQLFPRTRHPQAGSFGCAPGLHHHIPDCILTSGPNQPSPLQEEIRGEILSKVGH